MYILYAVRRFVIVFRPPGNLHISSENVPFFLFGILSDFYVEGFFFLPEENSMKTAELGDRSTT